MPRSTTPNVEELQKQIEALQAQVAEGRAEAARAQSEDSRMLVTVRDSITATREMVRAAFRPSAHQPSAHHPSAHRSLVPQLAMQQQQQQQQQGTMQQGKSGSSAKDEFNSPLFAVADTPTASQLEIVMRCGAYQTIEQAMGKLYAAMMIIEGEDTAPHHALYVLLALAEQEGKFSAERLQELTDDKNKQLIELTAQLLGQSTIKKMLNQILAMVWHPRASTARAAPHAIPPKPPLTPPPHHALALPPARCLHRRAASTSTRPPRS